MHLKFRSTWLVHNTSGEMFCGRTETVFSRDTDQQFVYSQMDGKHCRLLSISTPVYKKTIYIN